MMEQLVEKMRALRGVIAAVEKQFGKGAVMTLGDDEDPEPVSTIPTGSLALDLATGIGGLVALDAGIVAAESLRKRLVLSRLEGA